MLKHSMPFRRAHYVYMAAHVRNHTLTQSKTRAILIEQLVSMFKPVPGFKEERFRQACNADIPPTSAANKDTARKT
jgi:hypothetical protein